MGVARAIWTGSITFGLVSIPVGVYTATEDHTVHFHQFERGTSDRVRNQRVNERTGKEVDYADIVKGADIGDGEHVIEARASDLTGNVSAVESLTVRLDATAPVSQAAQDAARQVTVRAADALSLIHI